jgi:hypothetical protein
MNVVLPVLPLGLLIFNALFFLLAKIISITISAASLNYTSPGNYDISSSKVVKFSIHKSLSFSAFTRSGFFPISSSIY